MINNGIEKYGVIMKEEMVSCISNKGIEGSMVLETPEPFPGYLQYYHETPVNKGPQFVYFGVTENTHFDDIARIMGKARSSTGINFLAAFATLDIKNELIKVIRIRNIESYEDIAKVQQAFSDHGISFRKKLDLKGEHKAIIRIKKMFLIEDVGKGLFLDKEYARVGYFSVPKDIKWTEFEDLVPRVKNNLNHVGYDMAIGYFYNYSGIEDVVRVYSKEMSAEFLVEAKKRFFAQL